MSNAHFPLIADFLLAGGSITATVELPAERSRLVDLLNSEESILHATDAEMKLDPAGETRHFDSLAIAKASILFAIPRETVEHDRVRALQLAVVARALTSQARMAVFMPPLYVEGIAHVPGDKRLKLEPAMFAHFFSVTEAWVSLLGGERQQFPVGVINRNAIVAMSLLAEVYSNANPRSAVQPLDPSTIEKLIAEL